MIGVSPDEDFAEFFEASWDPCLRAVAASTGNMTLAEDQTAEAFARACASWPKVSRHPAPRAWVVRTALNAGASWWHRRNKETVLTSHDVAVTDSQGTGLDAPVLRVLHRLPARQREVVVLRIFLDLDVETTARADVWSSWAQSRRAMLRSIRWAAVGLSSPSVNRLMPVDGR